VVYAIYYLIPHLEWPFLMRNLIIHDWPLVNWWDFVLEAVYSFAYVAVFLTGACLVFRRKAVN
ncbi:MAG TPA: hypothetical protein VFV81_05540, partial [Verrucomicrobiae bacterium]|nr:hypothetical protein [Verrucomicrobiae bacterium]